MAQRRQDGIPNQWVWGTIIAAVFLAGCVMAYALRDTELVNPQVQQQGWLEMKQRR